MLIDRGGLVRPFVLGIGLFSVGLLIGGLAPTMGILVVARVIQGFGAGAIPAVAYVSIGRAMPERLRPRMFATLSTAWILPGVIGPIAASTVTALWDWRVVFLGLLPLIADLGQPDAAGDPGRGAGPAHRGERRRDGRQGRRRSAPAAARGGPRRRRRADRRPACRALSAIPVALIAARASRSACPPSPG